MSFTPAFHSYFCSCESIFKIKPITRLLFYIQAFIISKAHNRTPSNSFVLKYKARNDYSWALGPWKMVDENYWPSTKPSIQDFPLGENADTEEARDKFRFITFQDPNTVKLKSIQRVIRSHGAKKSLEGRKRSSLKWLGIFAILKLIGFNMSRGKSRAMTPNHQSISSHSARHDCLPLAILHGCNPSSEIVWYAPRLKYLKTNTT